MAQARFSVTLTAAVWAILGGLIGVLVTATIGLLIENRDLREERNDYQKEAEDLRPAKEQNSELQQLVDRYSRLTSYAIQHDRLNQAELNRFGLQPERIRLAGEPKRVRIVEPAENSRVPDGLFIRGDYAGEAKLVSTTCWQGTGCASRGPDERVLWIITQPEATSRYYPQGSLENEAGPALINADGGWVSPPVYFGTAQSGHRILVSAVLVSHEGSDVFEQYLKDSKECADAEKARTEAQRHRRPADKSRELSPLPAKCTNLALTQAEIPGGAEVLDTVMVIKQ